MDKGELKQQLNSSLSVQERTVLAKLLGEFTGFRGKTFFWHLDNTSANTLFGFLHKKMFGSSDNEDRTFVKVMENLDALKKILRDVPLYPQIPRKMKIFNKEMGEVFVSIHAWERFCEKFCNYWKENDLTTEKVADALQRCFSRAKITKLSPRIIVRRIIDSGFKEAEYLLNQDMHCRFVVQSEDSNKLLVTVEVPF